MIELHFQPPSLPQRLEEGRGWQVQPFDHVVVSPGNQTPHSGAFQKSPKPPLLF